MTPCHDPREMYLIGAGGYGATKTWYSGYYCVKCKRIYAETADGRHFKYVRKDTHKFLREGGIDI